LHDYEAGWLPLLVEMGVVTKEQANEAMCRVAQAAIDDRSGKFMSKHTHVWVLVSGCLGS